MNLLQTTWYFRSCWIVALLAPPWALADGPAAQAPQAASPAVASYRGGTVSEAELESWRRFRRVDDQADRRLLEIEEMLVVRTLAAAARERGLDREPALRAALRKQEEEVLARLLQRHVTGQVEVGGEETAELLRQHPQAFHRPRKVRLRNLFKRFPPDAGEARIEALRAEMAAIEERLRQGADFAELAARESDSRTRFQGGLIGNVPAGHLSPEIDAVAMRLEPGQISHVIETAQGLTLLKCDQIFEEKVPAREEVAGNLAGNLRRRRARELWEATEKELLQAAEPRYDIAAAQRPGAADSAAVVSCAGGRLTRAELPGLLQGLRRGPDPAAYGPQQLRGILERHVLRVAAAERARGLGLGEEPELRERLRWQGLTALGAAEMSRRVQAAFEPVTAAEVRAYHAADAERFERLPHFDLAVIHLTAGSGLQDLRAQYARAEEVLAGIRSGGLDFAAAARAHSDHPSAAAGGALGWLSRRQMARFGSVAWQAIQDLRPGEVSDLLSQHQDLWIFRLNGHQPARPMTLEEAAGEAEKKLGTERAREAEARLEERLRQELAVRLLDAEVSDSTSTPRE